MKYFFVLLLSATLLFCKAQDEQTSHNSELYKEGNFLLGAGPSILTNTQAGLTFAGDLNMEFFLGSRFSLKSDLVIGKDYVHFGTGIITIPLWMLLFSNANNDDEQPEQERTLREFGAFILGIVILGAITFEHTSYHIPITANADVAPSISLLRITFEAEDEYGHAGAALGCSYNQHFGRFIVSPFAEYSMFYDNAKLIFNAGVNASYHFKTSF